MVRNGDCGSLTTGVENSLKHHENVIFFYLMWLLSAGAFVRRGVYPLGLLSAGLFSVGFLSVRLLSAGLLSYTHIYIFTRKTYTYTYPIFIVNLHHWYSLGVVNCKLGYALGSDKKTCFGNSFICGIEHYYTFFLWHTSPSHMHFMV